MDYIEKKQFLQIFNKNRNNNTRKTNKSKHKTQKRENLTEFKSFLNNASVRIHKKIKPLKSYMKQKNIPVSDIKLIYNAIKTKDEYLMRFYNKSLEVPQDLRMTHPPMKNKQFNNNEKSQYKNVIRNMNYKGILEDTKSGIENIPTFFDVIKDLYNNNMIDYKILCPSSRAYIADGRIGSVFSSLYTRASILNPYLVYSVNNRLLNAKKVFCPTLSWGSTAYGLLGSPNVIEYVGVDVIKDVCDKTKRFAETEYPTKKTDIYCCPSESLLANSKFLNKYREHFDTILFSPPYFSLELYEGKDQSTNKYPTYEKWLEKYMNATLLLCDKVLATGGKLCCIIGNVGSQNTKENYDIVSDFKRLASKYFKLRSQQCMLNKNVSVTVNTERSEQIIVFQKK